MPCAAHLWTHIRRTKAPVISVGSITCFSIPFAARTCLKCSQDASCQQLVHGQPCYVREADRLHLPDYQQVQSSHWWVTFLDGSKVIACSCLNSSGLWNNIRPLWACCWFHSWTLVSTMGWLLSLSCLHTYAHLAGASSDFPHAHTGGHTAVVQKPGDLLHCPSATHMSDCLENIMGWGLRIHLPAPNWAAAGWPQTLRQILLQSDEIIVPDYLCSSSERIAKMATLIRAELNLNTEKMKLAVKRE